MCILNLYSDLKICMSLTIHYYVSPYNPIKFKGACSVFLILLTTELIHLVPPQSFSTIEYLVKNSFQIQSCDSYIPKISRGSITAGSPSWKILCVCTLHGEFILAHSSLLLFGHYSLNHETVKHTSYTLSQAIHYKLAILYIDEFTI